jgi:hypothetical protein
VAAELVASAEKCWHRASGHATAGHKNVSNPDVTNRHSASGSAVVAMSRDESSSGCTRKCISSDSSTGKCGAVCRHQKMQHHDDVIAACESECSRYAAHRGAATMQ